MGQQKRQGVGRLVMRGGENSLVCIDFKHLHFAFLNIQHDHVIVKMRGNLGPEEFVPKKGMYVKCVKLALLQTVA